jgi:hypothetical protein
MFLALPRPPFFLTLPLLALAAAAGCGHAKLVPAPTANVVPGAPGAAYRIVDGVRCSADIEAWNGRPGRLPATVTPVKVRIVNSSGSSIRLLYQAFALVGKSGRRYFPVPVLSIEPDGSAPRLDPVYAATKFFVAPRFKDVYQTMEAWPQPLGRDDDLYEQQYRRWGEYRPPLEVLRMGMPEGVLADGGVISGFLYFETPIGHEDRVTFEAQFDATDGQATVAAVEIPFRIQ